LIINAGRRLHAADEGWPGPAREVMEMLAMELIVLLGAVLALLLGAMVVTQLKRERLVRRQTPYGAWR
jgi:hypothetical protein